MLIKIHRQNAIKLYPILPLRRYDRRKDEDVIKSPKLFANYVLTVPSKSYRGLQKSLGTQLTSLVKNFGYDQLIFLGDIDIPWLKQLNNHKGYQDALQYLVVNKIGKLFNGAIQVDITELPIFIKYLSLLVRLNGILPYIHFTDPGQNVVGNICQYGNVHISTKNKTCDKRFKEIVSKSQFIYLKDTTCTDRFSRSNSIKGRTIAV